MQVRMEVESLRCTTGGSYKGYQIVKWFLDGRLVYLTKIWGTLDNPNQGSGTDGDEQFLDESAFKVLKTKLKKYNRADPTLERDWSGSLSEWLNSGGVWAQSVLLDDCTLWEVNNSVNIANKVRDAVNAIYALADNLSLDDDVEDLLRTPSQREKAKQEKAELESLQNWGCF